MSAAKREEVCSTRYIRLELRECTNAYQERFVADLMRLRKFMLNLMRYWIYYQKKE